MPGCTSTSNSGVSSLRIREAHSDDAVNEEGDRILHVRLVADGEQSNWSLRFRVVDSSSGRVLDRSGRGGVLTSGFRTVEDRETFYFK